LIFSGLSCSQICSMCLNCVDWCTIEDLNHVDNNAGIIAPVSSVDDDDEWRRIKKRDFCHSDGDFNICSMRYV